MKKLYIYVCYDDTGRQDLSFSYLAETEEEAYSMFLDDNDEYKKEHYGAGLNINDIFINELTEEELEEYCEIHGIIEAV